MNILDISNIVSALFKVIISYFVVNGQSMLNMHIIFLKTFKCSIPKFVLVFIVMSSFMFNVTFEKIRYLISGATSSSAFYCYTVGEVARLN